MYHRCMMMSESELPLEVLQAAAIVALKQRVAELEGRLARYESANGGATLVPGGVAGSVVVTPQNADEVFGRVGAQVGNVRRAMEKAFSPKPRPRGRAPKGKSWDARRGVWA